MTATLPASLPAPCRTGSMHKHFTDDVVACASYKLVLLVYKLVAHEQIGTSIENSIGSGELYEIRQL